MRNYFTKENIIKVFVAVVVIAFLLEIFAFTPQFIQQQTENPNSNQPAASIAIGNTVVNATVSSYAREILVAGSSKEFEAKASELRSQGKILYISRLSENRTLLNLASAENANGIARELGGKKVQFVSTATLSFPAELEFETSTGKKNASTQGAISMPLDPRIPVGANISLSIVANIQNETVTEYNARVIPEEKTVQLNAEAKKLGDEYTASLIFSWENRGFNELELSQTLSQAKKVRYTVEKIPLVLLNEAPANDSLEQLQNLTYVEKVQGSYVIVKQDFTNSSQLKQDFDRILGQNTQIEFPPSRLNLTFTFNNSDATAYLQEKLSPQQAIVLRAATLTTPDQIEIENATYFVSNNEFKGFVSEETRENETVPVQAKARIIANVIASLEQQD